MDVLVTPEPWKAPDAARLRAPQRAELDSGYGSDDHEPGVTFSADDMAVFVVARQPAGAAVGCGGLRMLAPDTAEIKCVYVTPAHRGTGVAKAILHDLEARAYHVGIRQLVLETGTLQPEAVRFYEREGYDPSPTFGPYLGATQSVCFARTLDPPSHS
ncbi:GNAT family N-acetyltransferase [Salinispora cortesiana]|uniref:GNAT family N-acetyltransferase n=1 Tax=Salinispora cortesiana TaxID=1305843 RepID=UPI00040CAFCC|nr:GNAT family N-acetyltransferase [Salinispora cortesiana]